MSAQSLRHYFARKYRNKNYEKLPLPGKKILILDKLVYLAGILGPIMTIPQAYNVWILKDVSGVSLVSWSSYLLFASIWLVYGIIHKEKPIIISYFAWIIIEATIVLGLLAH